MWRWHRTSWAANEVSTAIFISFTSQNTHHNHNIELLRLRDKLHSSVVDNHRLKLDTGVAILLLGDSLAGVEEKTVTELHNVSLVDTGDLLLVSQVSAKLAKQYSGNTNLPVVLKSKVKGEPSDSLGLGPGRDLQGLNDTGERLVLKTRVLALSVLTDNSKVDVRMSSSQAGQRFADNDRSVDIELLSHSDVPGVVTALVDGGVKNTFFVWST